MAGVLPLMGLDATGRRHSENRQPQGWSGADSWAGASNRRFHPRHGAAKDRPPFFHRGSEA